MTRLDWLVHTLLVRRPRHPSIHGRRVCAEAMDAWMDAVCADAPFMHKPRIDPNVRIGHLHLRAGDLDRAIRFYCGVLGFTLTRRHGPGAAFLSAGGCHHPIGVNTWESLGASPPPPGQTGRYHVASFYPTRALLGEAFRRMKKAGIAFDEAADHGVSEALYWRDPDQNGVELCWDRPAAEWPRPPAGDIAMFTRLLDLGSFLLSPSPAAG